MRSLRPLALLSLLALLLLALPHPARAGEADNLLAKAKGMITAGQERQALDVLREATQRGWTTAAGAQASALYLEVALKLGEWKLAEDQARRFLKYHARSPFRDRVEYGSARLELRRGELLQAARDMFDILRRTPSPLLYNEVRDQLAVLLRSEVLGRTELDLLLRDDPVDNLLVGEILFQIGAGFETEQRWKGARHFYGRLASGMLTHPRASAAQERLAALQDMGPGKPVLLLAGPLSGERGEFGAALLEGSLLALEQANLGNAIGWRAVDTRGQPSEAVVAIREVFEQENVVAVVGPVLSPVAAAVAAWISQAHPEVPMVSPTANADGLGAIGPNIFQINLPTGLLGAAIARHATGCLGLRDFVILAPRSDYGDLTSAAFAREIERAGGSLLAVQTYTEGLPDYQGLFDAVRAKGYKRLRELRRIARGQDDQEDEGAGGRDRANFLKDSTLKVDGIFIAASDPTDAVTMSKQAAFFNVSGRLLGTSGWYGKTTLAEGRKYVEGAIFASDFLERSDSEEWNKFRKGYLNRWKRYPGEDRVAGLSFDATRLVLRGLAQKGELLPAMRAIRVIPGVYGEIHLDPVTGTNNQAPLVEISDGKFGLVNGCSK